jgi:hypothetical protein
VPWLIITPAWPVPAAFLAGGAARVVFDPVIALGATAAVVTCAGVLLLLLRRARAHPVDRTT